MKPFTATDFQTVNRTLPILNSEKFTPADGETLFSRTPTFFWEAIEFSGSPIFYRLVILEAHSEKRVYGTGRMRNMLYHTVPDGILKSGQSYRWRVWAMDSRDGLEVQNRSNSNWLAFAMAETLNDFPINVAIKNVRSPDDNYATNIDIIIGNDFSGNLPNDIDSITITGPKGDLPITRGGFTYYPQFKDFYISTAGSPEAGRYAFTVTSGNLKAIATDTLSVLIFACISPFSDRRIPDFQSVVNRSFLIFHQSPGKPGHLRADLRGRRVRSRPWRDPP